MQSISELISAFVRWLVTFSIWPVRIRPTHRAIAFQHRFRVRLLPKLVWRLLPRSAAKYVAHYIPFTRKGRAWCRTVTLGPGIHWYWPKTTEVEVLPVERQTLDLPVQTLLTSDLQNVSIRAEVVFVIDDIRLAACKTFDFQQTIQDVAQLAVVSVVAPKSYEDLGHAMRCEQLTEELTDRLRRELESYGVGVVRAFLVDFAKCSAIRVYGGEQLPGMLPIHADSEFAG